MIIIIIIIIIIITTTTTTIAWKVWATEGYRLSKPISTKINHLLNTDNLELFAIATSDNKLKGVMTVAAKKGMESTSLRWNKKKCAVIHVKRGQVEQGSGDMKIADLKPIKSLDQHNTYNSWASSKTPSKRISKYWKPQQRHTYRGYQSSGPAHCQIMKR